MDILIVDDIPENVKLLKALLEGAGYGVVTAINGVEALERLRDSKIDGIVSDILMPDMDGFQLCRECKTDPDFRNLPFMFYTATYTEKKDREFALSLGAEAFVIKPQEPEVLLGLVSNLLASGTRLGTAPATPAGMPGSMDQEAYLEAHNDRLVSKLESKMADLEKTNQLLRESEEKYRLVVDNVSEAIMIAQDERIQFANPGCLSLLGYSEELVLGKPFAGYLYPEDRDIIVNRYRKRFTGEDVPAVYPVRVRASSDIAKWVEGHAVKILWKGRPATLNFLLDISERKRAEEARDRSFEELHKALTGAVQAIAKIVEVRDPYTAGHQKRVAHLAAAIAQEMQLAEDQVAGLRTAGMIHDIGKIAIPAEILSKPRILTPTEMKFVQMHSQTGYEILKEIEFPWPIARIVLEHHERMDGSGYPKGLKGEEICLASRILAIADTVEAMATHRPYRPALGIEAALGEITRGRGLLFDAESVDACLRLFREKDYKLPA